MKVKTRCFGEIEIADEKIVHFDNGIMGYEEYKDYTIIYDSEKQAGKSIMWLQSLDEQALALPVINPVLVTEQYDPIVEDELLKSIGDFTDDDLLILVTLTVPSDLTKMTANFKAPIVMNSATLKGIQIIAENEEYKIKQPIYDLLMARAERDGE